jgi:hypothetical protein
MPKISLKIWLPFLIAGCLGRFPAQAESETGMAVTIAADHQPVRVQQIRWSSAPNNESLSRSYFMLTNPEGDDQAEFSFGAGFYRAAYVASMARGKPFKSLNVVLANSPETALSDNTAALAVGIIGLEAGASYPADTAVIGDLYPDGTLKGVSLIRERVEALLAANIKRIIVPALQVGITQHNGSLLLLDEIARKSQAVCIPAATLEEAALLLWPEMSFPGAGAGTAAVKAARADFLKPRVAKLVDLCHQEKTRTEDPQQIPADTWLPRKQLLQQAAINFETGLSASRAGRFFEAYEQLKLAQSQYRVARLRVSVDPKIALPALQKESRRLLAQFADFEKKKVPGDSLPSAFGYFQTSHAASLLRGRLLASENLIQKLSSASSPDAPKDLQKALANYAAAVEECRVQADFLADDDLFGQPGSLLVIAVKDENAQFLAQLSGRAFLDGGERFFYRMQRFPANQRPYLLYETGFYHQLVNLLDARSKDEYVLSLNQELRARRNANLQKVAFVPGSAYVPPEKVSARAGEITEEPHPLPALMMSLNQISNQALLEFQLADSEATFDDAAKMWSFRHGTDFLLLLEQAERQAEKSLRSVQRLEIPSQVPELLYQRARLLASLNSERHKLEALREFWRCTQLCRSGEILLHSVRAEPVLTVRRAIPVTPASSPEAEPEMAAPAIP